MAPSAHKAHTDRQCDIKKPCLHWSLIRVAGWKRMWLNTERGHGLNDERWTSQNLGCVALVFSFARCVVYVAWFISHVVVLCCHLVSSNDCTVTSASFEGKEKKSRIVCPGAGYALHSGVWATCGTYFIHNWVQWIKWAQNLLNIIFDAKICSILRRLLTSALEVHFELELSASRITTENIEFNPIVVPRGIT